MIKLEDRNATDYKKRSFSRGFNKYFMKFDRQTMEFLFLSGYGWVAYELFWG